MLIPRLFIGSLLIAALLGLLYADEHLTGAAASWLPGQRIPPGGVLFAACAIVIIPLLALELARMLREIDPAAPDPVETMCIALAAFGAGSARPFEWHSLAVICDVVLLLTLLPAALALLQRDAVAALRRVGYWVLISTWIGWLPACWIAARAGIPAWALAWAVLTVKAGDIGAYFTGRVAGRHRLATWVSPKKSREGLLGGVILSAAVGAALTHALGQSMLTGVAFGAAAAFVGMLGDLAESVLKREANAKDSGRLLPGMGGIFDVMDSLLPTAPLALLMLARTG